MSGQWVVKAPFLAGLALLLIERAAPVFGADQGPVVAIHHMDPELLPTKPAALPERSAKDGAALPEGAGQDWWSQVQLQIEAEEYEVSWQGETCWEDLPGAYQALNRAQGFRTFFADIGFRLVPQDEKATWQWGLSLVGWGRPGALEPLARAVLHPAKNRLVADRPGISEWYVNDERGLEQGFTIQAPPLNRPPAQSAGRVGTIPPAPGALSTDSMEDDGASPLPPVGDGASPLMPTLHLDLALTGTLRPVISEDGQAVDFYNGGSIAVLRYADLKVTDAAGTLLPSRFEGWSGTVSPSSSPFLSPIYDLPSAIYQASSGGLRISIDDLGAIYPLTVDQLVTTPSWDASGENTGDEFGCSVATAGDVNGDGYSDVVVGARLYSTNTGKVYLYLGGPSGLSATPSWTAVGESTSNYFGTSVSTAGDVNGDGYSDLVVGARGYSAYAGKAYLYLGGTSGLSTTPSWTAVGESTNDIFGSSVATAGDVNGDGYSDIVVGAPGNSTNRGKAYLFLGRPSGLSAASSWTAQGEPASLYFAICVATAGDVNGDGYSDVIVGAPYTSTNTGKAYLYIGGPSGLSATFSWTAAGEANNHFFGISVATAGDVNGDGYSDVVVGAYGPNSLTGKAYLYLGGGPGLSPSPSWTASGEAANHYFGLPAATAGDVNGDGYSDVIIGASGYTSSTGKMYLYLGMPSGLSPTPSWTATGEATNNYLGYSGATAGDVNGDGYSDVIAGAYGNGSNRGKAYLYVGGPSGLSATASWTAAGEDINNYFGGSMATAGDVNGDGYSDVVVGASSFSNGTGKAYLYLGGPSGLSSIAAWTAVGGIGDSFGSCVATAGDVNGDGYSDVVVGDYGYGGGRGKVFLYLGGASGLASTAAWSAVGGSMESFGYSVATAGDVNGDGYSDVVVGASDYPGFPILMGRAYLYLGGASGLSTTATWTAIGEGMSNEFGWSIATAGDVNGDGYSDVVVGAWGYSSYIGKAYLYLGGPSGLSGTAAWTASGEGTHQDFGFSVSTAGDVNGDGYSDVLVGAPYWGSDIGKTYLYLGGPSGLAGTAVWITTGEGTGNDFGMPVATAGDVNGDGYSDVVVGARGYSGNIGKAYLYLGGPSGFSATPSWTASGENTGDEFGCSVATAGDVNGDGYSDIIVGADGNNGNRGKAYVYLGNGGAGVPVRPRQTRADGSVPISPLGRAGDGMFRIASLGRTPFGRGDVKLEWQVAPLGGSFSPVVSPIQTGATWTDCGAGGASLNRNLLLDDGDGPYIWRMRTRYRISTTPFQLYGPWFTPAANGVMETDLRSVPACVLPTGACTIPSVTKSGTACTLTWQDPNPPDQRTGWNVRRSSSASLVKTAWPIMAFNTPDADPGAPDCQWTDATGDISPTGIYYYQVTAYNSTCPAEGPF